MAARRLGCPARARGRFDARLVCAGGMPAQAHAAAEVSIVSVAAGRRTAPEAKPPAERLLGAAEYLFGERSYRRTTVADICARAGMATGSFYAHFDSKADIFAAVIRQINADLRAAMAAALRDAEDNQRARERASFRAYFDLMSRRPWIYRIVREAEFLAPGEFRAYYERLARGYARGVRVAQLAGEVDPRYDPEVIAYVYTGLGHFIGMRWAEWTAGGRVPDDIFDDLMNVLARGLPPPASPMSATPTAPLAPG
jgi:AcrR family transcriptional regulator